MASVNGQAGEEGPTEVAGTVPGGTAEPVGAVVRTKVLEMFVFLQQVGRSGY